MKHTIAILVRNRPGVMTKISGLFSRRGFNIDSLSVGTTQQPEVSRFTIVVNGDDRELEQIQKQLNKLIDVIKVYDMESSESLVRELAFIKVDTKGNYSDIVHIAEMFRAKIIDVGPKTVTFEVTGDEQKIDAIVRLLSQFGLKEMVRTGKIALSRGPTTL